MSQLTCLETFQNGRLVYNTFVDIYDPAEQFEMVSIVGHLVNHCGHYGSLMGDTSKRADYVQRRAIELEYEYANTSLSWLY